MKALDGLALIAIVTTSLALLACGGRDTILRSRPSGIDQQARGAQLVKGLAACGFCHGATPDPEAPLSGRVVDLGAGEQIIVPNITPAPSGVGEWNTEQLVVAIKHPTGANRQSLTLEAHLGYRWMSDQDLLAIVAYLDTLHPVEDGEDKSERDVAEELYGLDREVTGHVPEISPIHSKEFGRYLVENVARCTICHNSAEGIFSSAGYLKGGRQIFSEQLTPAISTEKFNDWSEEQIVAYLTSGLTPDGRRVAVNSCPTEFYKNATEIELKAIARFLKSDAQLPAEE